MVMEKLSNLATCLNFYAVLFVFEIANNKTMAKHSQSMSSKYLKMSWYFCDLFCVGVNARKCMNDLAKLLMLMYIYIVMLNEKVGIYIKVIGITHST